MKSHFVLRTSRDRQYNNLTIQQSVLGVLEYFSFFNYPPTVEEIHTFLKKKVSKRQITGILEKMTKKKIVVVQNNHFFSSSSRKRGSSDKFVNSNGLKINNLTLFNNYHLTFENFLSLPRYTLVEYTKGSPKAKNIINETVEQPARNATPGSNASRSDAGWHSVAGGWNNRQAISFNKLSSWKFRTYLKLLTQIPAIRLVGLSGSVAMLNAEEDHDIDLFIITAKNRLWTGRFMAILLAKLLGIHRAHNKGNIAIQQYNNSSRDKVCLNLFFDQSNLATPKFKRSDYVAHEVLQMKPLVQKDSTYLSFIDANRWVFDIFPNARSVFSMKYKVSSMKGKKNIFSILNTKYLILNTISNKVEKVFKSFQLYNISKHQTSEIVTASQLWFHPDDFEKKINSS